MAQAAVDSLTSGNPGAPVVRYPGMIGQHMQIALIKILLSAGVIATPENDNLNPERVLVFGDDVRPATRAQAHVRSTAHLARPLPGPSACRRTLD
ncbi:hypothetical protein SALBM311S_05631 [Streptomyces alboniger]